MNDADDQLGLQDAMHIVAIMGDLSMGQPMDHSWRVAALVEKLAREMDCDDATLVHARQTALLRWSGCTANAPEVAATISDDVAGRGAMLALQLDQIEFLVTPQALGDQTTLISSIHCEVSSLIATTMGLDVAVADALHCVFERWNGTGNPRGLLADAIPNLALMVSVCSDLEVFSRVHGLASALNLLAQRANAIYPANMVKHLQARAGQWLEEISRAPTESPGARIHGSVNMALIGQVIDLKLPWLTGQSRTVVKMCDEVAALIGVSADKRITLRRAGWLHGIGRVTIPNSIWGRADKLTAGEYERVRLVPYWTVRAGMQIESLAAAAELASHAHEYLDGTGYFRGLNSATLSIESRILTAVVAWEEHAAERPWRTAMAPLQALAQISTPEQAARFDPEVLRTLAACLAPRSKQSFRLPRSESVLSARETEVLRRISLGDSNKMAAQRLNISPSTVRTHLESIFKKLQCSTRAACTLRASILGLLD